VKENNALIILGMHRSGTSLLAGLLSQVGVKMGRSLYAPQKGVNEKGFWEHEDIVDTHDELLLHLNSQWDDLLPPDETLGENWWETDTVKSFSQRLTNLVERDFRDAPVWALKDPRMCRLLPVWFPIFASKQTKVTYICVNRNPFEVTGSLQKRDHFSREKALVLWLIHSLAAEHYSRGLPRMFIDFDQVVGNPIGVLSKIEQEANLVFPVEVDAAKKKIEDFVSPTLRHHKADTLEPPQRGLFLMAYELHQKFSAAAAGHEVEYAKVDRIAADFAAYRKDWSVELVEQIRYLNQERADYRLKFFRMYKSWSWLMIKPVWLIEKILRKY
jgi:hypothetical protein